MPGLSLQGASVSAAINSSVSFVLKLKLDVLKIMAGQVGCGARWDFVERDERIDRALTMVQTLMVRDTTKSLHMQVRSWVRRRRKLLPGGAARSWIVGPHAFTVGLET